MLKLHTRRRGISRSAFGNFGIFLILLIVCTFMLLPFVYSVIQSLKPMEEIFAYPPKFYVVNPTFESYTQIWQLADSLWIPFSRYIFNSAFVTVFGVVISFTVGVIAAFPLAKYNFPGNRVISQLITLALLFTGPVTALPQYIIVAKLGMIDTYWAFILPVAAGPLNLFLMKNFMVQISDSMLEAATIDGAGMVTTFYKICLPLVRPAILTAIILSFQTLWNSTGGSYIFSEEMKTLPTMLAQISTSGIARTGVSAAISILLLIPSLIVFVVLQSKVVETMAYSGIKE